MADLPETSLGGSFLYMQALSKWALAAAHTHLSHIEQEELQVEGGGTGGHLVGNSTNAIADLRTEREATSSTVL